MSETNISVPDNSLSATDCQGLADVLATIGDKWTIVIVGALSKGPLRYNEIQRRVGGISQRMLTLTLKRLEVDGIVTRTLFPSVPPRVDYELTQLGQTLRGARQAALNLGNFSNVAIFNILFSCCDSKIFFDRYANAMNSTSALVKIARSSQGRLY